MAQKNLIWYGPLPLPGVLERLQERGFTLKSDPADDDIKDNLLSVTLMAVFCHDKATDLRGKYPHIRQFINHGLRVVIVANRREHVRIEEALRENVDGDFPWREKLIFMTSVSGTNFDNFINFEPGPKWTGITIEEQQLDKTLTPDERLLVARAFPKAKEVHVTELSSGFSGARVFMMHEKRNVSSIAHWAQPRLVKIGTRAALANEVGNMREVSPFVPFELRPNLEMHVEGFHKSVFVADFVENSESLLQAARAGRAETAISNLFNRTLRRWRDTAWQCPKSDESLAAAAERLDMITPSKIHSQYIETEMAQKLDPNIHQLWTYLKSINFPHRVASIHGDLHGDNVRVRGDDAILIDLGSVLGAKNGAPLIFDVAMLEVALLFACTADEKDDKFKQPTWENEIRAYYKLNAIMSTPDRDAAPTPTSWLFGCLQRIRAFGIYDQSDPHEYAIALSIAMWRWCKFAPQFKADEGRRVVALEIGAHIMMEVKRKR